jgi:hypothetical protein
MVWLAVALLSLGLLAYSIPSEFVRLRTPCTNTVSCDWLVRLSTDDAQELRQLGLSVNYFVSGDPARFSSGLNDRRQRLCLSSGMPVSVVETRP